MEKIYRLVINEQEISISLDKNSDDSDVIRLPMTYFQNRKYVSQDAFFQEVRKKISQEFGTKTSKIKLDFNAEEHKILRKLIKENQKEKN